MYTQTLKDHPPVFEGGMRGHAQAHFQRALALHRSGRLDRALIAYSTANRLHPGHTASAYGMAAAHAALGHSRKSSTIFASVRSRRLAVPDDAAVLAEVLLHVGQHAEASILLSAACRDHPDDGRFLAQHGHALLSLKRYKPAVGALLLAIEQLSDDPTVSLNLACALFQDGNLEPALDYAARALRLISDPASPTARDAAVTLSAILVHLARYDEARAFADLALSFDPSYAAALANRSLALDGVGRLDEAVAAGRAAVAASAGNPIASHNLAVTLLRTGQLTPEAWALYEARLHLEGPPAWRSVVRVWEGEDISGLTLLLHAEQGFGDTLMFVRYAALLKERAGRVVLAVQRPLLRLLQAVPGVDQVVAIGEDLPAFDVACPLASLPRLMGTTLDTIPAPLPYADEFMPWDDGEADLRVGVVWSGNKGFGPDRLRSIPVDMMQALSGIPGAKLYSLQLREPGCCMPLPCSDMIDLMEGVRDFHDTAARIAGLDLVISVDTAVAHLAATVGKPVWLLARFCGCWRWLDKGAITPWYPSVRVVRQSRPNDWRSVLGQLRLDLRDLATQQIRKA